MRPEAGILSHRLSAPGSPAVNLSGAQAALTRHIVELLRSGSLAMVNEPCPCGAQPNDQPVGQIDRYGIPMRSLVCLSCGTVRFDPYFDEPSLQSFYRDYYQDLYERSSDPDAHFAAQRKHGARVLAAIRAHAPQSRTVIEVGCGAGGALAVLEEAGMRVAGCDHSERLVRFGQAQGVGRLIVGDIDRLAATAADFGSVDIVYLHHVFEHIRDPAGFLASCRSLLSPSGLLIAIVPDISRIDQFAFPAGDVRLFLHLAHKFNYSRQGLRKLGLRSGFAVEFLHGFESTIAPELWALFRPQSGTGAPLPEGESGRKMLRYLRRTELRYRVGLLPGYGATARGTLRRLARSWLPERVVKWFRA
jgi:SAM-dependent methyltransferase